MIKDIKHPALLQYDIQSKGKYGYSKQWLELVDWYLKPTEPVSDEDIEKWAYDELEQNICGDYERGIAIGKTIGAKAMRDGKIKPI